MSRRLFFVAALTLIALATWLALTPAGSRLRVLLPGSDRSSTDRPSSADSPSPLLPSKTNRRPPPTPKPTVEETATLLGNTRIPEVHFAKLNTIIIPVIDFEDTTLEEALDFLRSRSRESDHTTPVPNKKGINFVVRKPRVEGLPSELDAEASLDGTNPTVTSIKSWKAVNVPLGEALDEITRRTGLRWKIDEYAITILPADPTTPLEPHPKARTPDPN